MFLTHPPTKKRSDGLPQFTSKTESDIKSKHFKTHILCISIIHKEQTWKKKNKIKWMRFGNGSYSEADSVSMQWGSHPAYHWPANDYPTLHFHSCSCQCAPKLGGANCKLTKKQKMMSQTLFPVYLCVYLGLFW